MLNLNPKVTDFLIELNHPLYIEINTLRQIILCVDDNIEEGIKWNGPNYSFNNVDCITIKIQPPTKIQVIFHRGAKVKEQLLDKLIKDDSGLLVWIENDRAFVSFKNVEEIALNKENFIRIVKEWITAKKL